MKRVFAFILAVLAILLGLFSFAPAGSPLDTPQPVAAL
jgi:hypothetical protein